MATLPFTCNYGLTNTGIDCTTLMSVAKKLFFVPTYNAAGVRNTITLTPGTYTNAFFVALRDNTDPSARWYPSPELKNAVNKREASIFKSFDDNTKEKVQDGVRNFTAVISGKQASAQLKAMLDSISSVDVSFYVLDKDGNLHGMMNTPGQLDPIRLDSNSFDAIYNQGTDKDNQMISINFDILTEEYDGNLNMLSAKGDLDAAANLSTINGLKDITAVFSGIATSTTATFVMELDTKFGSAGTKITDKGLGVVAGAPSVANFVAPVSGTVGKVRNMTTNADVAVTSCTEQVDASGRPTGVYTIVLAGNVTAGNKIAVGLSRSGRDYSTIPTQGGVNPNFSFASV